MRTGRTLGLLVAVAMLVAGVVAPTAASARSGDSLYKRLGGDDAIAAVVDDLIGRMIADPQLERFFDRSAPAPRAGSGSTGWTRSAPPPGAPASTWVGP